jgi:hypothetical protein
MKITKLIFLWVIVCLGPMLTKAQDNSLKFDGTALPGAFGSGSPTDTTDGNYMSVDLPSVVLPSTIYNSMKGDFTVEFVMKANSANQILSDHANNSPSAPIYSAMFSTYDIPTWPLQQHSDVLNLYLAGNTSNQTDDGTLVFSVNGVQQLQTGSASVIIGDDFCHHIAMTYKLATTTLLIYIDGALVETYVGSLQINEDLLVSLGQEFDYPQIASQFYNGHIDEFRLWSDIRTPVEINQFKSSSLTLPQSNLSYYYDFNQGIASGNNFSTWTSTSFIDNKVVPGFVNSRTNGYLVSSNISGTYGLPKTFNKRGGWTLGQSGSNVDNANFVEKNCPDVCVEIIGGEVTYQKTLFTGSVNNLKTISTVTSGDRIYSVHQNNDVIPGSSPTRRFNEMIVTIKEVDDGSLTSSWKYEFYRGSTKVDAFSKELHVVNDGIYILANTYRLSYDGDNSSYDSTITSILMRIDESNGVVSWIKNKERPFSGIKIDSIPDNIFFNSFSPYFNGGKLSGWILAGSVRLKVNNHYRMLPALLRTDEDGNDMNSKYLEFSILCSTCNLHDKKRFESNWAVDITAQVNHLDYKYAILLESRDNFNGIVGHHPSNIRMSYLFINENLEINKNYFGPVKWWDTKYGKNIASNPRKILYDMDPMGNPSIKIVGQFTNNLKGFIAQFETSTLPIMLYNYNPSVSMEVLETFGLVDIMAYNNNYYALGRDRLFEFDQFLNFNRTSENFNSPIFTSSDFHVFNNYIGNLINIPKTLNGVPPSTGVGLIISDINTQTYRRLTDNLDQTCDLTSNDPGFNILDLKELNTTPVEFIPSLNYPSILLSNSRIDFYSECCKNNMVLDSSVSRGSGGAFVGEDKSKKTIDETNLKQENSNYTIYPNPAKRNVRILNTEGVLKYDKVIIYDISGKKRYENFNLKANASIDLVAFPAGVYVVTIITNDKISQQKLIVTD